MQAPPLLVSFSTKDEFIKALSLETRAKYETEIVDLLDKNLPVLVSKRCLAVLFGYSPKFVGSLVTQTEKNYRTFVIRKGKKIRTIHSPMVGLKVIQKWLATYLAQAISFDACVHGFVTGKSSLTAAQAHASAKWIYSVDIKDFFPSTPSEKIKNSLIALGYPEYGADIIAKLCCYSGFLAQGSPASPFLSNLVFKSIDDQVSDLSKRLDVTYTRYADDLVFSGRGTFPEGIKEVNKIIADGGWVTSEKKEHFAKQPQRLKVHGLLVHGEHIRLTKGYRNRIRAFKHLMNSQTQNSSDSCVMAGHIAYSNAVDKFTSLIKDDNSVETK